MPSLTWESKTPYQPIESNLILDSIIYPQGSEYPHAAQSDQLILGDNLAVMSALLPDYEGQIGLIYADPPFFTNRRYPVRVGRNEDSRRPKEWQLADGYPDHWPNIEAYLDMLYPRLQLMHRLLAEQGTLYLHLDWHADHYARLLMDEIFGAERLLNEIIWVYHGPSPIRSAFNRKHDTILAYSKSPDYIFNVDEVREPYNPNTIKTFTSSSKAGFGKIPDLERGKVPEDWWYFPVVARLHNERTGYPTQKPQALMERIILASSNPGDIVADFFCGAGTTSFVAAQLGRRFLVSDIASRAIHTTRSRHVSASDRAFSLKIDSNLKVKRKVGQPSLIQVSDQKVKIDPVLCDDLDFWEVDPDWDGQIFRSVRQAVRPWNKGAISHELLLPVPNKGQSIAVRLVKINGEQIQIVIPG
ncbi:MAG: DNA-methyltransferase [Anaerolineales bacterium]